MFTPRVRVYQFKTSLSAGTIDGGMACLPAVPGGTYHAFARLDVSVEVDTGMIWFRSLRMPNCSVPFVLALDIPHDPIMRILQSDLLTTY